MQPTTDETAETIIDERSSMLTFRPVNVENGALERYTMIMQHYRNGSHTTFYTWVITTNTNVIIITMMILNLLTITMITPMTTTTATITTTTTTIAITITTSIATQMETTISTATIATIITIGDEMQQQEEQRQR